MNDHSRSIDIRHHAIRQDYVNGEMRIGGVTAQDNTSDILTKNLQPPLHIKHVRELNIFQQPTQTNLQNCVMGVTLRGSHRTNATRNCSLAHAQQLALDPPMKSNRPSILTNQQNRDKKICGPVWVRATLRSKTNPPAEHQVNCSDRHTSRYEVKGSTGTFQEILHKEDIVPRRRLQNSHRKPKEKQQNRVRKGRKTLGTGSLNSTLPQPYPVYNRRSQHHPQRHSILNKPISKKTQRSLRNTGDGGSKTKQKDPTNPFTQRSQQCTS
jgi:hypothetical protein